MYILLLFYFILLCFTFLLQGFDESLLNVHVRYHRFLRDDPDLIKVPNRITPSYMLSCAIYAGILLTSDTYPSDTYPLYGVSYDGSSKLFKGYMMILNDVVILSLCSTSSINDILVSLDDQCNDLFHSGYMDVIADLLPEIYRVLLMHRTIRRIYLSGHSLGGALVSILGHHLVSVLGYTCHVYTFGSPKYAHVSIQHENYEGLCIQNYINQSDPVVYKPVNPNYIRLGQDIMWNIDTGNDNVNHGVRVYKLCVTRSKNSIQKRPHRLDELFSRFLLDLLS
jgi:hypothetical protein